jgi:hypothetical protein
MPWRPTTILRFEGSVPSSSAVLRVVTDQGKVKRDEMMQVVQGVPAAWDVSQAARGALVNLLSQRAEWLADGLPGLLWAQQELKL